MSGGDPTAYSREILLGFRSALSSLENSGQAQKANFRFDTSLSALCEGQLERVTLSFPPESAFLRDPAIENCDLVLHHFLPDAAKHVLHDSSAAGGCRPSPPDPNYSDAIHVILYRLARCAKKQAKGIYEEKDNLYTAGSGLGIWSFLLTQPGPGQFPGFTEVCRSMTEYVLRSPLEDDFADEDDRGASYDEPSSPTASWSSLLRLPASADARVFSVRMGAKHSSRVLMHWTQLLLVSAMEVMPEFRRVVERNPSLAALVVEQRETHPAELLWARPADAARSSDEEAVETQTASAEKQAGLVRGGLFNNKAGCNDEDPLRGNKFASGSSGSLDDKGKDKNTAPAKNTDADFAGLKRSAGAWKPSGKWRQKQKEGDEQQEGTKKTERSEAADLASAPRGGGLFGRTSRVGVEEEETESKKPELKTATTAATATPSAPCSLDISRQASTTSAVSASSAVSFGSSSYSTAPASKANADTKLDAGSLSYFAKLYSKSNDDENTSGAHGSRSTISTIASSPSTTSAFGRSSLQSAAESSPPSSTCPSVRPSMLQFLDAETGAPSNLAETGVSGTAAPAEVPLASNNRNGNPAVREYNQAKAQARAHIINDENKNCFVKKSLDFLTYSLLFDLGKCGEIWDELEQLACNDWFIQNDWCISFEWTNKEKWRAGDLSCFFVSVLAQVLSDTETHERQRVLAQQGRLLAKSQNVTWANESVEAEKVSRFAKEVLARCRKQHKTFFEHIDLGVFEKSANLAQYYGTAEGSAEAGAGGGGAPSSALADKAVDLDSILEIGAGDFSFADSFTASGNYGGRYLASSKETREALVAKYGDKEVRKAMQNGRFSVLFNIDVSLPQQAAKVLLQYQPRGFSTILFINPHAGDEREKNVHLLEQFFEVCALITLAKPDVHYQQWNVSAVANRAGFRRVASKPFFVARFPGYHPVYGDKRDEKVRARGGKRENNGAKIYFTCNPITYIFEKRPPAAPTGGNTTTCAGAGGGHGAGGILGAAGADIRTASAFM
eukprot:g7919.t1